MTESSGSLTTNFGSLASTQNATFTFDVEDGAGGSVSQTLVVGVTQSSDANDTVDFSSSAAAIELKAGLDDIEIITGTNFDDTLIGGVGIRRSVVGKVAIRSLGEPEMIPLTATMEMTHFR